MRRPFLALLLLAACGPRAPEPGFGRYAVLTSIPENDPLRGEVEALAAYRRAEIFQVASFDAPELEGRLRAYAPDYVVAVARPAEITNAAVGTLTELLRRLDDDPFPDAALGWFVASDPAFLRRQVQALRGAEAKVEKRLLSSTVLRSGPRRDRTDRLEWADGLPLRRLDAPPEDVAFLQERLSALQRCDYLLLGAPPLRGLRLDSAVVFSEVPGSGNPFRPWISDLLQAGAAAVFAPLGEERAAEAEREWADAIASDAELGETWRRSAETAILAGQPAAARLLYGCPRLDAYTRPARAPYKVVDVRHAAGEIQATLHVVSWDNPSAFAEPGGQERLHVRLPAPAGARRLRVIEARAEARGRAYPVSAPAAAVERRGPATTAHALLRAPRLAVEDLFITLRLKVD